MQVLESYSPKEVTWRSLAGSGADDTLVVAGGGFCTVGTQDTTSSPATLAVTSASVMVGAAADTGGGTPCISRTRQLESYVGSLWQPPSHL